MYNERSCVFGVCWMCCVCAHMFCWIWMGIYCQNWPRDVCSSHPSLRTLGIKSNVPQRDWFMDLRWCVVCINLLKDAL